MSFRLAAERACGYVIDAFGDKHLDVYTKADANAFRDALIEQGLSLSNPFDGVYYDRSAGISGRNSIPEKTLRIIQRKCREANDDRRWLVAMVSDTRMRLAEAAGSTKDDIVKEEDGSLVARARPHSWRRLKTKGSERDVPFEGEARWAAERILKQPSGSPFAFPHYNSTEITNANAASAALNSFQSAFVRLMPVRHICEQKNSGHLAFALGLERNNTSTQMRAFKPCNLERHPSSKFLVIGLKGSARRMLI